VIETKLRGAAVPPAPEHQAPAAATRDVANLPQYTLPFLQPGRLVSVLLPDRAAGPITAADLPQARTPGAALIPDEPTADRGPWPRRTRRLGHDRQLNASTRTPLLDVDSSSRQCLQHSTP
jgi:hypothetical protein